MKVTTPAVTLVLWLAACRFGGPSGSPYGYVAFPDDADSYDGGADEGQPGPHDASAPDVTVADEPSADAPSTGDSTQSEASFDGGSDGGTAGEIDGGPDAACTVSTCDDSQCQQCESG